MAGYLSYEAGGALEPKMAASRTPGQPYLSFGIYERPQTVDLADVGALVGGRPVEVGPVVPAVDEAAHAEAMAKLLGYIEAGDIYQANLTLAVDTEVVGHPLTLYMRLRAAQRMAYGALAHDGASEWLLSASPELFFTLTDGRVTARPMKGTAKRAAVLAPDRAAAEALMADPKNRAENLMITDLIRNDLSRIAAPGSVGVSDIFMVERYPTVHQMVTGVGAELADGLDAIDVIRAMFPCGSITGAPKVRAAQIIDEVEWAPRGVYTGSMGWIAPNGNAAFNVAIRTARLTRGANQESWHLRMGVGAGIVADSEPQAEWKETLAKAAFLSARARPFHLIETMRFDAEEGICHLDRHMERLAASAERFDFAMDRHDIRNVLQAMTGRLKVSKRVKLTLAPDGDHAVALTDLPKTPDEMTVSLVPLPVAPDDVRLFHKTSDREFYDGARKTGGTDEVILVREDGALTEGSYTNLFVERGGILLTPPADLGMLPGILRGHLLDEGRAREERLTADDLDGKIFMGNAVRGLVPARLVARQGRPS